MKDRFAHFLVAHSRVILIIFILLAFGCAALIPLVHVNQDMTKYLPKDSAMRQGLDRMETEFGKEDASSLEIMFNDLDSDQARGQVLQRLEQIPHVDSVDYDFPADDEDAFYNRDGYTRYIINCDYEQYSPEAAGIWTAVQEMFVEEHEIALAGSINDANTTGLPLWIAVSAVALIVLVLLIMANSWIEPVAFLITIGVAVGINMGTYTFFPSISKTTFSIVAILQLALSMDYSIMLLNRYRQQRLACPDKRIAMERALSLSFGAITGSSLTTFAGLLALVFMSFTMGADIGLALAKGVIISLLCIFTVLQALLLGFDSLMLRTIKPTPPFDLPRLSWFQFRLRIPLTLLFVVMFVTALIARSGVDFSYSQVRDSEIDTVFGHTNTIVMVYDEKDGAAAETLAKDLEDDPQEQVRSAVCYESTLGKQRTAAGMKDFIEDMNDSDTGFGAEDDESSSGGSGGGTDDLDLSASVIRLIYYDYYAGDPQFRLTVPQFVSYLRDDVLEDPDFGSSIDRDVRDRIDDMTKYTDRQKLTTPMSASGLANFFGMKTSQAKQLLLYYQIKCGHASGGKMTLPHFVDFLLDDVAKDPDYGSMMDSAAKKKLRSMRVYTRKKKMTRPVTYQTAADLLGMDDAQMRAIYMTHYAKAGVSSVMTIADLATALQAMAVDPVLKEQFGGDEIAQLIAGLQQIAPMDPTPYDAAAMEQALADYGMPLDVQTLTTIYAYADLISGPDCHKVSVQKIVHFLLSEDSISDSLSEKQQKQLRTLRRIIDTSVKGRRLSASAMAHLLGMKKSDVRSIYLLHQYKHGSISGWKLTPQQFINFLATHVLNDASMRSRIGDKADDLKAARKLINSVVAGKKFTYRGLADLLEGFRSIEDGEAVDTGGSGVSSFDAEDLCLLYELYGSEHYYDEKWTMDLMQMVIHLDENMVSRPAFASSMEEDEIEDLHEQRADMDEAAEKLEGSHHGRMMISATLPEDSDETRAFMETLTARTDADFSGDTYLIGNTPMAYEMSQTFHGELNRITLLTALFIFIIVLLTFRRLATSVILVLIIQCAVFMTMALLNALHIDMNYLALLIVQSIMMGATIDYAIIYTTYYVENRDTLPPGEAIRAAFRGSLKTILTSAIILIVAVGILSFAFSEPASGQICRILSFGCLIATVLVIFLLPGILACLDRLVVRRGKTKNPAARE